MTESPLRPAFPRTTREGIDQNIKALYEQISQEPNPEIRVWSTHHLDVLEDLRDFRFHSERADVSLPQRDAVIDMMRKEAKQSHRALMSAQKDVADIRSTMHRMQVFLSQFNIAETETQANLFQALDGVVKIVDAAIGEYPKPRGFVHD